MEVNGVNSEQNVFMNESLSDREQSEQEFNNEEAHEFA